MWKNMQFKICDCQTCWKIFNSDILWPGEQFCQRPSFSRWGNSYGHFRNISQVSGKCCDIGLLGESVGLRQAVECHVDMCEQFSAKQESNYEWSHWRVSCCRHVCAIITLCLGNCFLKMKTSWSWALLDKLSNVQLLNNLTLFYWARTFITVFTGAIHCARSIQSMYPNLSNIYLDIVLWFTYSSLCLFFWRSRQHPVCFFSLPHACYMPCISHPTSLRHCLYTWRRAQVMKFLIMQFSPTPHHFILLL
jgi:hypothetical protein